MHLTVENGTMDATTIVMIASGRRFVKWPARGRKSAKALLPPGLAAPGALRRTRGAKNFPGK